MSTKRPYERCSKDEALRQKNLVLALLEKHGKLSSHEIQKISGMTLKVTTNRLRTLKESGHIAYERRGMGVVWFVGKMIAPIVTDRKIADPDEWPDLMRVWGGYPIAREIAELTGAAA